MAKKIPFGRRQLLAILSVLLLFCLIFRPNAYADEHDMNIVYTVTEDMLPKDSPSPVPIITPKPDVSPNPLKGYPKTGDESNIMLYVLVGSCSLLGALGTFVFYMNRKKEDNE